MGGDQRRASLHRGAFGPVLSATAVLAALGAAAFAQPTGQKVKIIGYINETSGCPQKAAQLWALNLREALRLLGR